MVPIIILLVSLSVFADARITGRIYDGLAASESMFPYAVEIRIAPEVIPEIVHACGGAIIDAQWILTAAHCLISDKFVVAVGSKTLDNVPPNQIYRVDSVHPHPDYDKKTSMNDIGLIKLKTRINFNTPNVRQIAIGDIGENEDVLIAGWGTTLKGVKDPPHSNTLNYFQARTFSTNQCSFLFIGDKVTSNNICTRQDSRRSNACEGDSGSPLVTLDESKLLGVLSFGGACGLTTRPDVFTRVVPYLPWINQVANLNLREA